MSQARNNQNYKRLRAALGLSRDDVVEVLRLGGVDVSKSRADAWGRGEAAEKWSGTGQGQRRMAPMSDEEFDSFCAGLVEWMKNADKSD